MATRAWTMAPIPKLFRRSLRALRSLRLMLLLLHSRHSSFDKLRINDSWTLASSLYDSTLRFEGEFVVPLGLG